MAQLAGRGSQSERSPVREVGVPEVGFFESGHGQPSQGRGPHPWSSCWLCLAENVVALMPEAGSPQHARVLQYRELLDALPMDAYTHGCILHPELTTDSMIPKYATAEIRSECPGPLADPILCPPAPFQWESSLFLLSLSN